VKAGPHQAEAAKLKPVSVVPLAALTFYCYWSYVASIDRRIEWPIRTDFWTIEAVIEQTKIHEEIQE